MWVVTLTYRADVGEAVIVDEWGEWLDAHDASVAVVSGRGVEFTAWIEAPEPIKAAGAAEDLASSLGLHGPVAVEVADEILYERDANTSSLPELVSAPEAGELLGGISRQRVNQLQARADFPAPLYRLRTGPVWDARAIRRFADEWQRRPGRPPLAKTS